MKPLNATSIFARLREAANRATREVGPDLVSRFAARVAATAGDQIVERIAAMSTRDQLEALREVLTREQFALVTELYDVLHAYALRTSVTTASAVHRVSSNN